MRWLEKMNDEMKTALKDILSKAGAVTFCLNICQSVDARPLGCHHSFSGQTGHTAKLRAALFTIHRLTWREKHMWASSGRYQLGRSPWKGVVHRNEHHCLDNQGLQRPSKTWPHRSRWSWARARYPSRLIDWLTDWSINFYLFGELLNWSDERWSGWSLCRVIRWTRFEVQFRN